MHDVTLLEILKRFRVQFLPVVHADLTERTVAAAQQSGRRISGSIGDRANAPLTGAAAGKFSQLTKSPAPGSRPTGIGAQLPPFHHHRRQAFNYFGRYTGNAAGKPDGVQAVLGRPRAGATDLEYRQGERRILATPDA